MPHVSRFPLKKRVWEKVFRLFLEGLKEAKNKQEIESFLEGFFAPTERVMLAKRFAAFFLLEKGVEGREIAEILKISTGTVSRLKLWWNNLPSESKKLLQRLILKKEIKNLFADTFKTILPSFL